MLSLLLLLLPVLLSVRSITAQPEPESDADVSDEEVLDAVVEEDEEDEGLLEETGQQGAEDLDEDSGDAAVTSHPDADTTLIFITGEEFIAGEMVKFLLGFSNKGEEEFTVGSLEASFRYPQDYNFYIQNFTALQLEVMVQPHKQASFEYSFIPAQPMAGRPFGLVILLNYHDSQGNVFQSAVYNQTVMISEVDEGLDGETIFMYIFLTGLISLLLFSLYQVLEARTRRRAMVKVETGSRGMNNVDISWIPQETLNLMNKASPRPSPRKRATRSVGVADQ